MAIAFHLGALLLAITSFPVYAQHVRGLGSNQAVMIRHIRRAKASGQTIMPFDQRFFSGKVLIDGSQWLVVFCGSQAGEACAGVRQELGQLSLSDRLPADRLHFAEVNCTFQGSLCHQQNFSTETVAVVHYSNGGRQATWSSAHQSKATAAADFKRWFWTTFRKDSPLESAWNFVCQAWRRIWSQFSNIASDFINWQYAPVFICTVVFQVAVVFWVILDGFEIWPKSLVAAWQFASSSINDQ
mmetsp:Transcript_161000/g.296592  ORF Transcript_161000/g.296592 Transcript_161000/m.296592 type:complete len:242 (+) Transcript_161000:109-834(+)